MAKTLPHRTHPAPSADTTERGVLAPVLGALWVLGYLALFLATPTRDLPDVPRGSFLLSAIFRPDDVASAWFAGASWMSLVERAAILAVAFALLAAAAAAGWICLRLARVDRLVTRLEMTLLSAGVGLNVISLATLALGLAGLLRRDLFVVLGVLACLGAAAMRRLAGCESGTCSLHNQAVAIKDSEVWNWSPRWLWLLLPFTLAITGAALLAPLDFDVREYHLQAPKEFYQAGQITFLPHNVYANMPLGTEMLALAGMVVTDDWWTGALVGKALIGLFAPLAALLLYAAGCRLASPAAGIVAALVYLSLPWVAIVSSHGLVEGAFAFYLLAALYLVLLWQRELPSLNDEKLRRAAAGVLAIAGFLAGGAVATKYPAVVYCAIPLTIYVAVVAMRQCGFRRASAAVGILILGIVLGCGLWFLKNAVLTGNPTYPLLYNMFGGATWTPAKELQWQAAHRPPGYEPIDLVRRLWELVLLGTWISPLVVPLALLAFFSPPNRRLAGILTAAVMFIFLSWWLLTHRIDRFLVPMWPLAALLAGLGATWNAAKAWRYALMGFLAVGLACDFVVIAGGPVSDNRYLTPLTALREESVRLDPWHAYLNEHANDVRGVLLVGDAQPFDLEVPTQYNTVFDNSIFEDLARGRTPEQVRAALLARDISHVYVAWPEIERYRSPGNYGITEFLQPRIFAELTAAGVLEELPPLADHDGEMYRVRSVIAR